MILMRRTFSFLSTKRKLGDEFHLRDNHGFEGIKKRRMKMSDTFSEIRLLREMIIFPFQSDSDGRSLRRRSGERSLSFVWKNSLS